MRKALYVGIDDYSQNPLSGCVKDATRVANILKHHENGDPNFTGRSILSPPEKVTAAELRRAITQLLEQDADMALFYFSGHGVNINSLGGYLVTSDATEHSLGVPMSEVSTLVNKSPVREIVIILDCCSSGAFGAISAIDDEKIFIRNGVSILTASGPQEVAIENGEGGVFTKLVCDALEGGASDVRGEVNAASIYSYCDQTLGAWDQRPRFMAHVSRLSELRMCKPQVDIPTLRLIATYFPTPDYDFPLDPSFEPDKRNLPLHDGNETNERIFGHLQKYRSARLLVPVGEEHMYFAAEKSKSCKLTPLGQHYWKLVKGNKI